MKEMTVRLNKIEEKVKTFLREHELVEEGKHVCVCFSGGADSCVLLHILYRLQKHFRFRLSACHFNHMIRGSEAEADELFCRQVCKKLNVTLFSERADVPSLQENSGKSMEETARDARYSWFASLGNRESIDLFATAHHKNDQAETVLFRILRGTTVSGLSGIPIKRDRYIRPLMCLSRSEIEQYAREHALSFQTDSSNFSSQYTRNYIRRSIFPMIEHVNPASIEAINRLSRYAAEDCDFFEAILPPYEVGQDVSSMHIAVLRRVVMRNFSICTGKTLCFSHIEEICNLAKEKRNGKVGLPDGYQAQIIDGKLFFRKCIDSYFEEPESGILAPGRTFLCGGSVRITFSKADESALYEKEQPSGLNEEIVYNLSTQILLSCDDICGMIRYRVRLPGDRLKMRGVNRSIKKLFSEQKIPIHLRRIIPVFSDDKEIFFVPFVGVSDRFYASNKDNVFLLKIDIADEKSPKGG